MTEQIEGQLDMLDLLAPAPAPVWDLPPLVRHWRPLTALQDYADRYPHWLRAGEQCPACGFRFDYPGDASNNHGVPFDADPSGPVCTAMYLTRDHVRGSLRQGDPTGIRRDVDRAARWWGSRLAEWLPDLLREHGLPVTEFMPAPPVPQPTP